jgi:hypothetical protein
MPRTPTIDDRVSAEVGELEAWARRAAAANGFGDCVCQEVVDQLRVPAVDEDIEKECEA